MTDNELNPEDFGDEAYKDADILYDLYWNRRIPTTKMADILSVSKKTILNWMRKHDIDRRPARRRPWATYTMVNGYMRWTTKVGDSTESVDVARLLAVAEYGYDAVVGKDVHHKNGIRWLNYPDNIELKTPSEHRRDHNLGEGSPTSKLTESDVRKIKSKIPEYESLAQLAREYDVSRQTIYDIRDGRSWSHIE